MQSIQTLHAEAHPEVFKPILDPIPSAFFADLLSDPRNIVLMAEYDQAVVGYLWCQEHPPADSFYEVSAHTGYINHVAVDVARRRRGIGQALVEAAVAELESRGATRVGVDFWSFNAPARAFFAGLGFAAQRQVCVRQLA
ncbi:GNAT family N-acetyltransferase [Bauldia sp.]|uniref:GNAT family N-acetyltransferase n=1 Tax=Bauldia sp. TaxID=2575872 RepID=UPI003BAA88A7